MARLIIKNGYIKGGKKNGARVSNLVKYIATRDGVEFNIAQNTLQTQNQKNLIRDIIKEFPNSKNSFEYDDYKNNPSAKNASDFITIALEQHIDKIQSSEKYLSYIANRPRVEKISTHGLFSGNDEDIVLSKVVEEIANHCGNIWTPIISLRREDAEITGYDNLTNWKLLIDKHAMHISDALRISHKNFRWYAAMHNESHHPHVHMICYSINPNEGYLSKLGIEKMKSALQTEIFKAELLPLYTEKSKRRDKLKAEVRKSFTELNSKLQTTDYTNPQLEALIEELGEKLKTHKGKKQYGYLQAHSKNIVNAIVDELAKEPNVKSAYELWCDLQDEIYNGYNDAPPRRIPLSAQKEFKSIKNMIIKEVLQLATTNKFSEENLRVHTHKMSNTVFNLLGALSHVFEKNMPSDRTTSNQRIDSKALRKLREKKQAAGQKDSGVNFTSRYRQSM